MPRWLPKQIEIDLAILNRPPIEERELVRLPHRYGLGWIVGHALSFNRIILSFWLFAFVAFTQIALIAVPNPVGMEWWNLGNLALAAFSVYMVVKLYREHLVGEMQLELYGRLHEVCQVGVVPSLYTGSLYWNDHALWWHTRNMLIAKRIAENNSTER